MTTRPTIYYIFSGRFPSEKAHALYVAKFCESLSLCGYSVVVLTPKRRGSGSAYDTFFGIQKTFVVRTLPTIDLFGILPVPIAFPLQYGCFAVTSTVYLLFKKRSTHYVFSNEVLPAFFAMLLRHNVVYEMHDYPQRFRKIFALLFRGVRYILTQNTLKAEKLVREYAVPRAKIIVEQNAVDVAQFSISVTPAEARAKLGLPLEKKILLYTGHLYAWKGVATFARAVALLPPDYIGVCVGGTPHDVAEFSKQFSSVPRLTVVGHRPYAEIPWWLAAADVLVLPNTKTQAISEQYTSPMKLFEYMAAKRPIIASNLPSIREVVSDQEVFYVDADTPQAIADRAQTIIAGDTESAMKIKAAYLRVQEHTWQKRSGRIVATILR